MSPTVKTPHSFSSLKRNRTRILLYLGLFFILSPLPWISGFQLIENRFFDWFSTLSPPVVEQTPVILVGIDEPSFAELRLQGPWPRNLHSTLIDSLTKAGAKVIAFDIVFAEPSNTLADNKLAAAIKRSKAIVLATEETILESAHFSQHMRIEPLDDFLKAGAVSGLATVTLDGDSVLRRLPTQPDSFAMSALSLWLQSKNQTIEFLPDEDSLIQYLGPSQSYPYVSYYQALQADKYLPPRIFQDRIVIIGQALKTSPDPGQGQADAFASSFTLSDGLLTAGFEVQATMIDNIRLGLFLTKQSQYVQWLMFVMIITLSAFFVFKHWHPLRCGSLLLTLVGLVCLVSFVLLRYLQIWLPPTLTLFGLLIAYLFEGALAFINERSGRRNIKQAFGHYLSPAMVEKLAANPLRLKLGGESRDMTLMFCDVRGFTSLSERFRGNPAGLTHIMNRFLTVMTDAVLKYGGTIDKYIGDCIMAFWNAPLDDPNHIRNACLAALDMLKNLEALNEELQKELSQFGEPLQIKVGVGINSGLCVVGNIGSEQRFDYSVLGDPVNLASRLEGQSKIYGVNIVLGQESVKQLENFAILELDLIAVKGKSKAVYIFALLGDEEYCKKESFQQLQKQHSLMLQEYRNQHWQSVRTLLDICRQYLPELDELYDLYAARIEAFEQQAPAPDWTGVYLATSK